MLNNKLFRLGLTMRTGVCILALVGAVALITSQVASQDKDSPPTGNKQPSPKEVAKVEQEMMKLWQELSTPGENHKHLEPEPELQVEPEQEIDQHDTTFWRHKLYDKRDKGWQKEGQALSLFYSEFLAALVVQCEFLS